MTALPSQADLPTPRTFADMGVDDRICAALGDKGITTPFPIQELTLPLGLSGADVIGQARTGTGKTLAFGIPLLQNVDPGKKATQALVVVPTRELCVQVRDDLEWASAHTDVRIVSLYGGKAIDAQREELAKGAPVVVGTPGRLLDMRRRGALDLSAVRTLVLDEADEMLDLGFLPDVEQLIQATHSDRQTLLFSATMPSPVVALARRYMRKPTFLRADVEESRIAPETRQYFFACHPMDKAAVLARILQAPGRGLCLAFTRTKRMADRVAADLRDRGVDASPIHSDLRQDARERALARFRSGKIDVLVATEVAARGLDITDVTHVVNYDCPDDEKMYLHRIGRTGRAGAAGAAITLAVWNEQTRLEVIKKALGIDEPTHEVFSTSPILDEIFDLPAKPDRPRVASEPTSRSGTRPPGREQRRDPKRRTSAPDRPADRFPDRSADRSPDPSVDRSPDRSADRSPDPSADRSPDPSVRDDAEGGPRRVRRRRRSATSDTATGEGPAGTRDRPPETGDRAGSREGTEAGGSASTSGEDPGTARTRTRRRTRRPASPQSDAAAAEKDAERGQRPGKPGAEKDAERGQGPEKPGAPPQADSGARAPAGDRQGAGAASEEGQAGAASQTGQAGAASQKGQAGASQRGRSEGRNDRQTGRGRGSSSRSGRRGRRGGRRPSRDETTPAPAPSQPQPSPRPERGNARGSGRPRLTRPLSIAHLP